MNVAANLLDYLKGHDSAELAGFGTFYVESRPARISSLTGEIEPPCRLLTFKVEEKGDCSFVESMAKKEFISSKTALDWIRQYSASLKEKIDSGKSCEIKGLGTLGKDYLGNYVFEPLKDLNLLDDSFAFTTLKNVKTFYIDEQDVKPIRTVESSPEPEVEPEVEPQPAVEPEPEPVQEFIPTETVSHTEAIVEKELEKVEVENTEGNAIEVERGPEEKATVEPVQKIVEIEDIQPAKEDMRAKAQAIIDEDMMLQEKMEHEEEKKRKEKKRKKKLKKRRKRILVVILTVLLLLILLCGALVAGHYYGLLKDYPFFRPLTERLDYYIKPKVVEVKPAATVPQATITETIVEETYTETVSEQMEIVPVEPQPIRAEKPEKRKVQSVRKDNDKQRQEEQKAKVAEMPQEDNSPVVIQNYSKLGFDVIGGEFSSKDKAERLARKAKSLGYDSYVLSKVKSGTPIYYVSYGSRRTLQDANNLMAKMKEKMGGEYYIISR